MKLSAASWFFVLVSAAMVVVACGTASSSAHPDGDAARGETLFAAHCAACHGDDAQSGSARQDLPGAVADDGIDEIFLVVQNGKDDGEMPAFKDELTEQEIADILAWLETQ